MSTGNENMYVYRFVRNHFSFPSRLLPDVGAADIPRKYAFIWKFLKTTIARRKMKSHFPNWTLDTHYVLLSC